METFSLLLQFITHLDQNLVMLTHQYGIWIYAILFVIIFSETGLVVAPFLPGDSLLFVAGAVAAGGELEIHGLVGALMVAAFLGNLVNFQMGRWVGPKVFHTGNTRFLRREYLDRAHAFYEHHGGKTIIISRFLPIIRTYAPFVAGIGHMPAMRFTLYNLAGAALWVGVLTYAGYFFGNLPLVKNNLTLLVMGIVVLSLLPAVYGYLSSRPSRS